MATTASEIQALYVAYFNRPAEPTGLAFWLARANANGGADFVANEFANSQEYRDTYKGMSNLQIVDQIYLNLFGRHAEAAGLVYWAQKLDSGELKFGNVARIISTSAQNADKVAIDSKLAAAAAFTGSLTTAAEILGYDGPAANAVLKAWLSGINTDAQLKAAITDAGMDTVAANAAAAKDQANATPFNLTVGVDNIVGTAGNDVIHGDFDVPNNAHTLSGLDKIDGGTGVDTVVLTDSTTTGGAIDLSLLKSMTNVEKLSVTAVKNVVGNDGADGFNVKAFAGLTEATFDIAQGAAITVTAATTTGLNITTDNNVTIVGGGTTATVQTAGDVTIGKDVAPAAADKNAFTSVTIAGAAVTSVTDNSGASGAIGNKLTTVSLDGQTDAATLTGDGINTVSVANSDQTVDIINTKAHALNLTVNAVATGAVITDASATSVVLNAADDSQFALAASHAASLTAGGAGALELDTTGAVYTALASVKYNGSGSFTADLSGAGVLKTVDASAATGDLDITIVGTNTDGAAQSVTGGAGDDTVTLTGTLGDGSTLSLGAGSDVVKVTGAGEITGDAVVDAGAGDDTLALAIVGDANVGAFKNFESFDVAGIATTFDEAVLDTLNNVKGFIGTAALGGNSTLDNLGAGVGFTVKGDMTSAFALTLTQATAGALTITSDVDESSADAAANTSASTFVASNATSLSVVFDNNNVDKLADVANAAELNVTGSAAKTLSIVSGGSEVVNTLDYTAGVSSGNEVLTSATITGTQHLVFNYDGAGTLKLASVDASGQTDGGLTFDLSDLTAAGTLKLGAGDDIITLGVAGKDTTGVTTSTVQNIVGLEKGSAEGLTAQDGFDVISFGGAIQANDVTAAVGVDHSIKDGVYTFIGAGAANLAAAVAQIAGDLANDEVVVFTFAGNKYVYGAGADASVQTDDLLVKVTGTADIHGVDVAGAGNIYVF